MIRDPDYVVNLRLRLSEALRQRLDDAAAASGRSMNAEIIRRLDHSFDAEVEAHMAAADAKERAAEQQKERDQELLDLVSANPELMAKVRQMAEHVAGLVRMAEDDPDNEAMGKAADQAIEALESLGPPRGPQKLRRI
jgi:predicted DNA-binding protein